MATRSSIRSYITHSFARSTLLATLRALLRSMVRSLADSLIPELVGKSFFEINASILHSFKPMCDDVKKIGKTVLGMTKCARIQSGVGQQVTYHFNSLPVRRCQKRKNKAGYTAQDAPSTRLKITRNRRTDEPTDGPTDRRTDGRTRHHVEMRRRI